MLSSCCNKIGCRVRKLAYWKLNVGLRHLVPIMDRYADTWFALMYGGKFEGGSLPLQFPFVSLTFLVISPIPGADVAGSASSTSLFKQSLCEQINQTEAFYRYVLFIEVKVKNGEH